MLVRRSLHWGDVNRLNYHYQTELVVALCEEWSVQTSFCWSQPSPSIKLWRSVQYCFITSAFQHALIELAIFIILLGLYINFFSEFQSQNLMYRQHSQEQKAKLSLSSFHLVWLVTLFFSIFFPYLSSKQLFSLLGYYSIAFTSISDIMLALMLMKQVVQYLKLDKLYKIKSAILSFLVIIYFYLQCIYCVIYDLKICEDYS